MTWGEFKSAVERQGVKDDTNSRVHRLLAAQQREGYGELR